MSNYFAYESVGGEDDPSSVSHASSSTPPLEEISDEPRERHNGGHTLPSPGRGLRWTRSDRMYIEIVRKKYDGDPKKYVAQLEHDAESSSHEVKELMQSQIERVRLLFNLEKSAGLATQP